MSDRVHDKGSRTKRRRAVLLVCAALACLPAACNDDEPASAELRVRAGHFEALDARGQALPASAVAGRTLSITAPSGVPVEVRVDKILDEGGEGPVTLYEISRLDPETNTWVPYCKPGPDGLAAAIPLPGRWREGGRQFVTSSSGSARELTLTCSAGANGKCARMGYVPGTRGPKGEDLTPAFEACVHMMRGDYCGDGQVGTKAGVAVDLVDDLGLHPGWTRDELAFEAAWGAEGAVCVRRARVPDHTDLAQIVERCPRLADAIGEACTEDVLDDPEALLLNRSTP